MRVELRKAGFIDSQTLRLRKPRLYPKTTRPQTRTCQNGIQKYIHHTSRERNGKFSSWSGLKCETCKRGSTKAQLLYGIWGKTSAHENISQEDPAEQRIKEEYNRAEELRHTARQEVEVALHERARIIRLMPNLRKEELT